MSRVRSESVSQILIHECIIIQTHKPTRTPTHTCPHNCKDHIKTLYLSRYVGDIFLSIMLKHPRGEINIHIIERRHAWRIRVDPLIPRVDLCGANPLASFTYARGGRFRMKFVERTTVLRAKVTIWVASAWKGRYQRAAECLQAIAQGTHTQAAWLLSLMLLLLLLLLLLSWLLLLSLYRYYYYRNR